MRRAGTTRVRRLASRSIGALLGLTATVGGVWACTPAEVAKPAAPVAPQAPRQPPTLTPLPLPAERVVVARFRDSEALFQLIDAWVPTEAVGLSHWWRAWLTSVHADIDASAAIEAFVALDPSVAPPTLTWVLGFPLREPAEGAPPPAAEPGEAFSAPNGLRCGVARALGAAARRLVCAPSDRELEALTPIATRALPLAPLAEAAAAAELHTAALTRLDRAELRRIVHDERVRLVPIDPMNERFAKQLGAVSDALRDELVLLLEDLDGARLRFDPLPGEPALGVTLETRGMPSRSRLLRAALGSGVMGLVPNSLWGASKDTHAAGFWWSFEPEPLEELRPPLAALLGTVMGFRGLSWRLQLQAQNLVENLPLPAAPIVFARGSVPPSADAATPEPDTWWVLQASGELSRYRRYAGELVRAFDDPVLGPQLVRVIRAGIGEHWAPASLKLRGPRHPGLGAGSFVLELTLAADPDAPAAEARFEAATSPELALESAGHKRYLIVATAGADAVEGGLKLGWASDEAFLTALMADGRHALKTTDTLATRDGLASLVSQRALGGGFSNLRAWLRWLGPADAPTSGSARVAQGAPHGGLAPILYSVARSSDEQAVVARAKLGVGTFEDLRFLLTSAPRP